MCVAIIVPKGVKAPNEETLLACERANAHGGGIAWIQGRRVHWRKGVSTKDILQVMQYAPAPYFIHFRIATAGGVQDTLCHPFGVDEKANGDKVGAAPAVLMHNGHWSGWRDTMLRLLRTKVPKGPWSDSRAMAYIAYHYGTEVLELIDEKVAVMHSNGTIEYYGSGWQQHEGCWYSNLSWKYAASTPYDPNYKPLKGYKRRYWPRDEGDTELDRWYADEVAKDADIAKIATDPSPYLDTELAQVQAALTAQPSDMLVIGANGANGKRR